MIWVVLMLLVGVFIFAAVMYRRAKSLEAMRETGQLGGGRARPAQLGRGRGSRAQGPKSVRNLEVNDIVTYLGQDFMVEGKLIFEEDGDEWYEYMLVDGADVRWLCVEEDDVLELSLYKVVKDMPLRSDPGETVEYEGVRFIMQERGVARMRRLGRTGSRTAQTCGYWDYSSAGGGELLLSVERWGQSYEVSVGQEIDEATLDVLSGELIS